MTQEEKTLDYLKKDLSILIQGIENKKLYQINFNSLIEYLAILQEEITYIKEDSKINDYFISYNNDTTDYYHFFDKKELKETIENDADEEIMNHLKNDFLILAKGIESTPLNEINFESLIYYISMLKEEVNNIKRGIKDTDYFISRSTDLEDSKSFFKNKPTQRR